jgi:regulator of protease activity HflC (stomatin/prohibitin superfamily)
MSILSRQLNADESAVIVQTDGRPPLLVNGPGSVRTFWRWRQMIFVDLKPLTLGFSADGVVTKDAAQLDVRGDVDARVVSPVDAATKVVNYSQATRQITETAIRGLFRGWLSTDLTERLAEVEAQLLDEVRSAAESWGLSISDVRIQLLK